MKKDKTTFNKKAVIFTDLDDTLLEHETYEWKKAGPALEYCRKSAIPVILVSSKTRAEMAQIHSAMKLDAPFVSENGGGIFFPKDFFDENPGKEFAYTSNLWKLEMGTSYEILRRSLKDMGRELGLTLRGFSDMTAGELSRLTGLSDESLSAALSREFDEPFIIDKGERVDTSILEKAAEKRGLMISEGGRFFHLHGNNDKGAAVEKLLSLYRLENESPFSIALGDSPNDFGMFYRVDQPVLVSSEKTFSGLKSEFPGIIVTNKPGPEGWNSAVLSLLPLILNGGTPDV